MEDLSSTPLSYFRSPWQLTVALNGNAVIAFVSFLLADERLNLGSCSYEQ